MHFGTIFFILVLAFLRLSWGRVQGKALAFWFLHFGNYPRARSRPMHFVFATILDQGPDPDPCILVLAFFILVLEFLQLLQSKVQGQAQAFWFCNYPSAGSRASTVLQGPGPGPCILLFVFLQPLYPYILVLAYLQLPFGKVQGQAHEFWVCNYPLARLRARLIYFGSATNPGHAPGPEPCIGTGGGLLLAWRILRMIQLFLD